MPEPTGARARYEVIKEEGASFLGAGRLEEALESFDRARALAEALDDQDLADLAFCNRSAVAIRLGRPEGTVTRLQEILLQTENPHVAALAAYNLSWAYDLRKDFKKVIFYGRLALDYAEDADQVALRASALNQLGNAFAGLNQFESALEHYREGLGLLEGERSSRRALLLNNVGYACTVLGLLHEAFGPIFESLRILRQCSPGSLYEIEPQLTLAFAYLHIGRPDAAKRHAFRAFESAERTGDLERLKYALLLLGESHKLAGEDVAARDYFDLLQETFYPDMPEVPGMLLSLDVCKLINLKA